MSGTLPSKECSSKALSGGGKWGPEWGEFSHRYISTISLDFEHGQTSTNDRKAARVNWLPTQMVGRGLVFPFAFAPKKTPSEAEFDLDQHNAW